MLRFGHWLYADKGTYLRQPHAVFCRTGILNAGFSCINVFSIAKRNLACDVPGAGSKSGHSTVLCGLSIINVGLGKYK
jgi:hypothetical protein